MDGSIENTDWTTVSSYPPIAEYAFLSDCEVTALVAPSGNVEWMCLPRMDGPSIFGAILDRDAGGFRFGPADARVPAARRYLPGTMILETSWGTPTGWVIVRDCLLIGPWHHETSRSNSHRRAPTDYDCEHVFLREVRCVNGEVQMSLDCSPMFELRPGTGDLDLQRRRLPRRDHRAQRVCAPAAPHDRHAPRASRATGRSRAR